MKNRAFHFEIKDLLTQFVAAFDDAVISRYNKSRQKKSNIEVRYVFAPKQRVMYDIINKAQNLTLPVVAINLTGVTRDETRVFNKLAPSYIPAQEIEDPNAASKFLMPVPVNLQVSMSILARYMQDVDQIVSNFVPYNNPYIILSWKVPADFGAQYDQEIRSEVLWSGDLAYTTPTETTYNDHYRVAVDTSFTIKGWLFPEQKDTLGSIYKIDSNFINVDLANRIYEPSEINNNQTAEYITYQQQGYGALSAYDSTVTGLTSHTETITVSGIPEFTNIFYTTTGTFTQLRSTTTILTSHDNNFMLYGKRFSKSDFYLSANNLNFFPKYSNYQEITSAKSSTISGYTLDSSFYNIASDNVVSIFLPTSTLSASGKFTFIAANEAGWGSSYQASSSILNIT
tara:strand:+ start:2863 stop:4059 length:1197 start_codon:yes stop_codon:yes gene_type:complete